MRFLVKNLRVFTYNSMLPALELKTRYELTDIFNRELI